MPNVTLLFGALGGVTFFKPYQTRKQSGGQRPNNYDELQCVAAKELGHNRCMSQSIRVLAFWPFSSRRRRRRVLPPHRLEQPSKARTTRLLFSNNQTMFEWAVVDFIDVVVSS